VYLEHVLLTGHGKDLLAFLLAPYSSKSKKPVALAKRPAYVLNLSQKIIRISFIEFDFP